MDKYTADLFGPARPKENKRHVYTVSEITQDVKILLENTFGEVWVEGEVSGVRRISTGTIFFTLKDDSCLLKCVVFSQFARGIKFDLKDGIRVICFGRIGVYEKDGQYQLYAEVIEPRGIGSLQLAFEQLKEKLEKEGLFSTSRKRPVPFLPAKIGVVTSLSGAAVKDILKVLDRRFGTANIVISPAQVQGTGAGADIARAIKLLNEFNGSLPAAQRIDVMIVGRGGGSIEDLWAFNEEVVARAIHDSAVPVISAVGHERDWTIADLVADLRAPTPSVAAELVIPRKEDLLEKLDSLRRDLTRAAREAALDFQENIDEYAWRMQLGVGHIFELNGAATEAARKKLSLLNPQILIVQSIQKVAGLAGRAEISAGHCLEFKKVGLAGVSCRLSALSPLNVLSRGYSISFKMPAGSALKDIGNIKEGEIVKTRLEKGEFFSRVTEVKKDG